MAIIKIINNIFKKYVFKKSALTIIIKINKLSLINRIYNQF